jgi:hypothetical protein
MLVVLACMIATALVLQGMFDASDHAKSERIVRGYRTIEAGAPLGERVEKATPGGVWSSEILHGCRGYVRVRYSAPGGEYVFDYDVPQHRIHPGNDAAARLLAELPAAATPPGK